MIRGFFGIGVAMATLRHRHVFYVTLFSGQGNVRELVPPMVAPILEKFGEILRESFENAVF